MNARSVVLHRVPGGQHGRRFRPHADRVRTPFLPGQRRTEQAPQLPEAPAPAASTDLRVRLAERRATVRELAQALREHSLVAELVASAPSA